MAYHLYNTDAFIIASYPVKEADTFIILFTRDLGMIQAVAPGSKKIDSKLRYNLKEYSITTVSLIRGKAGWKIVGASVVNDCLSELRLRPRALQDFVEIVTFIRRMVMGESVDEELFAILLDGYEALKKFSGEGSTDILKNLIFLRILAVLGYIEPLAFRELLTPSVISLNMIEEAKTKLPHIQKSIAASIAASQL